jgi:nicotinamidase-related amidase/type 1 glutamine amidotransferase
VTFTRLTLCAIVATMTLASSLFAEDLKLQLRYQAESSADSGRFHRLVRDEQWSPAETAVIVCDVWDLHHCLNAVRRLEEFAPRLNDLLSDARRRGVTVIHSPSDCMEAYADHPARKRALDTPKAAELPPDIRSWCSRIPSEEKAVYPVDQSDGGEDDDPEEHAEWAAKLKAMGRKPGTPWKKQSDLITIDPQRDFISDRGEEVWSILESRGIKNVILTGVHTNMCVLGRPFGLRQMARNGKNVVLVRDMTDTMYNPKRWPYVSHFTGNDLIVSHIEKYVCPTITSDQLLGGRTFRYKQDTRPHLAIMMAEDEYETERTLPIFASKYLGKDFRVSFVFGSDQERNLIPGLDVLNEADVLLVSVRRRVLRPEQMAIVRRFVEAGKPVVGIRTASHAFSLGQKPPPDGYVDWPEFDAQVFGGNYHGHHGNNSKSTVRIAPAAADHPILTDAPREAFAQGGSLYQTSPLADGTTVLAIGRIEGQPEEPIAWTFRRADKGRSFYTSMGHKADFDNPAFVRLLMNGIYWAADLPIRDDVSIASGRADYEKHWSAMPVPASWEAASAGVLKDYDGVAWYRCVVRIPQTWTSGHDVLLNLRAEDDRVSVWFNGHPLKQTAGSTDSAATLLIQRDWIEPADANLIVVRVEDLGGDGGLREIPVLTCGSKELLLKGRWQFRIGDDPAWSNMPLPAKFGASTDIVFEPRSAASN